MRGNILRELNGNVTFNVIKFLKIRFTVYFSHTSNLGGYRRKKKHRGGLGNDLSTVWAGSHMLQKDKMKKGIKYIDLSIRISLVCVTKAIF